MLFAIQRIIIPIELSSFDAIYLMDCRSLSEDYDPISVSDSNPFSNLTSDLFSQTFIKQFEKFTNRFVLKKIIEYFDITLQQNKG